jgi:hypothetical protein
VGCYARNPVKSAFGRPLEPAVLVLGLEDPVHLGHEVL